MWFYSGPAARVPFQSKLGLRPGREREVTPRGAVSACRTSTCAERQRTKGCCNERENCGANPANDSRCGYSFLGTDAGCAGLGHGFELGPQRDRHRKCGRVRAWDNFSSQWYSSSIPGDTSWSQTDAAFAGTAGTVTISSGITANNLFFYTSGYQITGNTLNLTGGTISVLPKNASDTINSAITGNSSGVGLTQTGTGTLTLNGPAFYTGPTNVSSGTLLINGISTTTGGTLGVGSKTFGTLGGSGSAAAATFTVYPSSKNGIIAGYTGSRSLTIGGLDFQGGADIYISNVSQYSSSAAVVVTGNNGLTVGGAANTISIVLSGPRAAGSGSLQLLQYSGAIQTGSSTAFIVNANGLNAGFGLPFRWPTRPATST